MSCFGIRLKLFLKDRAACICWIACAFILTLVLMQLNLHAAERSALPVGLEVRSEGMLAQRAVKSLHECESLYIYEDNYDTLFDMLTDGYIYCIISIGEDFDRRIALGESDGIMTLYSAKDDKVATVVGDIAAGCCMDAVCMYKAYNTYVGLSADNDQTLSGLGQLFGIGNGSDEERGGRVIGSIDEYSNLLNDMETSGNFDYDFDFKYVDTGASTDRDINNGLIYRQVITGLMGLMIMLSAFCSCSIITREYESGIRTRIRISAQPAALTGIAEILALFVCTAPLALVVLIFEINIPMILINLALILGSVVLYYLLANALRNIFAYQLTGSFVLIALGVCGFVSIFEGLAGGRIFSATPMGIYIKIMSDLM
ncbi:MAG: ABC transporter permease [Lachnospiraceae bacterium]|nr:ABC transporter permease [Lachnospiraceae bacterium]